MSTATISYSLSTLLMYLQKSSRARTNKKLHSFTLYCPYFIGMNSEMMTQYIQFVADRLCVQLGYKKIYNVTNCFPWMTLISLESKTNFFEKKSDAYALANKKSDTAFEFNDDF